MKLSASTFASALLASVPLAAAQSGGGITINVEDKNSIISATKQVAKQLRSLYPDKESWFIPGLLGLIDGQQDKGYYWWEAGALMGAYVDYWYYTKDDQYNDMVTEALLFQTGPNDDYEPLNQTLALGNDDQAFWGIAVMQAAERGFPDPPKDKPQWLALAQAVFNRQASRWDTEYCDGGLRWQVTSTNKGYDYKNTISNGLLFHLGGRLARYTDNSTYADWAMNIYQWTRDMGLLDNGFRVYDGSHIPECVVSSRIQWTYNAGVYLSGSAYLYDYYMTKSDGKGSDNATFWKEQTQKILEATDPAFFENKVMQESACERLTPDQEVKCNTDQRSFKAYLSRFFGITYSVAPFTQSFIMERLKASAVAAAKNCNGVVGDVSTVCGLSWREATYDGSPYGIAKGGVGEQMSALEVFQNLLATNDSAPLSNSTGGTSAGDSSAGTGSDSTGENASKQAPSTGGDKAGAGVLTTLTLGGLCALTFWLVKE